MRHRKTGRKLNRNSSHRKAMFRNMVTSLFKYDKIQTTDAKAKELRILADRMITLAKRGDLHARRQALSVIREKDVVHKLFDEAKERFGAVAGGYTRIVKIGHRPGDAAPISLIELVTPEGGKKKKPAKKKAKPKAVAEKAAATEKKKAEAPAEAPVEAEKETAPAVEETGSSVEEQKADDAAVKAPAEEDQEAPEETGKGTGSEVETETEGAAQDDGAEPEEDKKPSDA